MKPVEDQLLAALESRAGVPIAPIRRRATPWMSVTFAGLRHEFELALPTAAAERLADGIEHADFHLRGHVVADIRAEARPDGDGLLIEALTIADC